jgi:hypothetical protein
MTPAEATLTQLIEAWVLYAMMEDDDSSVALPEKLKTR